MISKTINISDKTKAFYYDEQLTNKMTLVSLHASTEPGPPPKYSKAWSGKKLDDDGFYGEDPICKSVIAEDFTVSINNTFSEFGGDAIGQAWTSFVQPLAPYVGAVGNDIEKIAQKAAGLANDLASKSEYEFVKTGNDKLITKYLSNPKSVSFSSPCIAGSKWKPRKGRGFKTFYDMDPVFEAKISRVKDQHRGLEDLINGIKNWQAVFNLGDSVCYKYRFVEYEV